MLFFYCRAAPRDLLSFPTRRSSDLTSRVLPAVPQGALGALAWTAVLVRSEEHTSELQSLRHLVCRLLLEKKKYATDAGAPRRSRETRTGAQVGADMPH